MLAHSFACQVVPAGFNYQLSCLTYVCTCVCWCCRCVAAAVALVLCLNIGVDPPDVIKISPCARLECWVDPLSMQPAKALETIGEQLAGNQQQQQQQPAAAAAV
jgi:hypothetical protein